MPADKRYPALTLRVEFAAASGAMGALLLLALLVWPGLMLWASIVFFIAGTRDAPAANDLTPVGSPRKALGYFTFLLLLLIIVPVPQSLFEAISVYCRHL